MRDAFSSPASPPDESTVLVLGGVDFGEADRVVHLLGRQGRLSVFAPGAKASKRRFGGALEPFQTIRVTIGGRRRPRGGLPTLAAAVVETSRIALRGDLERIALASYVVELAGRVAPEGEDTSAIFELTNDALDALVAQPARRALRRAFEVRLLGELGYRPALDACVVCGETEGRRFLELSRGGVLCAAHRQGAKELGPKTLAWLGTTLEAIGLEPEGGLAPEEAEIAAERLSGPVSGFFAQLLERPLGSSALLADLGL